MYDSVKRIEKEIEDIKRTLRDIEDKVDRIYREME
jgi:prefoldin subunit 5